jgi:hypothetical protein
MYVCNGTEHFEMYQTAERTLDVNVRFEVFVAVTMKTSSGMLRHVAVVRTDVSVELSASIIRVTRLGELGMSTITSNRRTLQRNTLY